MKDLIIGIVGGGVVGKATARTYIEHVKEVRVYDVLPERRTDDLRRVLQADLIFVCLPTPQVEGSLKCNLSAVEGFFAESLPGPFGAKGKIEEARNCNFVLRSTVPIGTTRLLRESYSIPNLVHSPEFLTARCANTDALLPSRNIIGQPGWMGTGHSIKAMSMLEDLYISRFPSVPIYLMSSDESEAVKLIQNSWFATKIGFFNEMHSLCDALGLDWQTVLNGVLADGRISHSHTNVPGPDGKHGFGGTCLPKDLANLIICCYGANVEPMILNEVHRRNNYDRKKGG